MRNIVIKESNRDRINKEIQAEQRRASVRLITVDDVFKAVKNLEEKLKCIPKVKWDGVSAQVDVHSDRFPRGYGFTAPMSTHFWIVYRAKSWKLVAVQRRDVKQTKGGYMSIQLPKSTKDAIIETFKKW